MPSLEQKKKIL